jgi:anti-anti-sigma regulatory factor
LCKITPGRQFHSYNVASLKSPVRIAQMADGPLPHQISVPTSVTMRGVSEFASQLLEACQTHSHVVLDINAVEEVDLSFLQAIHAAHRHMEDKNGTLRLARPARGAVASLLKSAGFSVDPANVDFWFHGELPQ